MFFRNLNVTPEHSVSEWGVEGVLTAFERGDLSDWHRVFLAYRDDASGETRRCIDEALAILEAGEIRPELAGVFRLAIAMDKTRYSSSLRAQLAKPTKSS